MAVEKRSKGSAVKKMVTPAAKREAVAHLQALLDVSERRACRVIEADRTSIRYRSRRGDDTELREKLRELAHQRRRFGYRRLHILLRRDGVTINRKKTQRHNPRRRLDGASPQRPQTCGWNAHSPTCSGIAEPMLEPRF